MALRGTGVTTLTFANNSQAAQYAVSTVVTDSAPNPNQVGWTNQTVPASSYRCITYGNGMFISPGGTGSTGIVSSDGCNWTTIPSTSPVWVGIIPGNGIFVAIAHLGYTGATTDGITWNIQQQLSTVNNWSCIGFGNGTFVAICTAAFVGTSSDGINWTQRSRPAGSWGTIAFGNGVFVTVTSGSATAYTSPDGITWTPRTLPVSSSWNLVTFGNGKFVAVAGSTTIAATSPDGITWTPQTIPVSAGWGSIAYGSGTYVVVAYNSSVAATSPDGITWTQQTMPTSSLWIGTTYGAGVFAAIVTNSGTIVSTSPDGTTFPPPRPNTRTITTVNTQTVPAYPVPGSNTATATITGLPDITSGGSASALLMASDSTASHNAYEHGLVRVVLRCADFVAGVGFTIYASSPDRLDGAFEVRYAWSA